MKFKEYEIELLREDSQRPSSKTRQALDICDKMLGKGLYTEKRIQRICENQGHYFYLVMKEQRVVGVFYCYREQLENVPFLQDIQIPFLRPKSLVGVGQSIALKKEARATGLSEWLLNYGTQLLFEKEQVEAIFVPAWMKKGMIPADRHLTKCSYALLRTLRHPWAGCEGLECPICKTIPCSCDGAVYIRRKKSSHGQ